MVRPLLTVRWPGLPHAAGRLGTGSEVLGLDDAMSRDHDWGLRLTVLVDAAHAGPVDRLLADELPESFRGLPTRFALTNSPDVRHRVDVATPAGFVAGRLGVEIGEAPAVADWLSMTGQALAEVTGGAVFADTAGELTRIRGVLEWYPHDVWLQVLAADWSRLAEEFPFVGRTGLRGDDAGSRVIAARLCGTLMHLGFVLERRWPPYSKWLGTAFAALPRAGAVTDELQAALRADSWPERQDRLAGAARLLHDRQRSINLPGVDEPVVPFHDRPFLTVRPDLGDIVRAAITDPAVRALPGRIGAIEQWVDNVAVLASPPRRRAAVRAVLGGVDLDEG